MSKTDKRKPQTAPASPGSPATPTSAAATALDHALELGTLFLLGMAPMMFFRMAGEFDNNAKLAFVQWTVVPLVLAQALRLSRARGLTIRFMPLHIPIVLFYGWCAVSLTYACNPTLATLYMLQFGAGIMFYFFLVSTITTVEKIDRIFLIAAISIIPVAVTGLLQVFWQINWVPQLTPPASTFSNKNMAAQFIAMAFPLILGCFVFQKRLWGKCAAGTSLALALLYLIYTENRTAPLTMCAVLILLGAFLLATSSMRSHLSSLINWKKALIVCAALALLAGAVSLSPIGKSLHIGQELQVIYNDTTKMQRGSEKLRTIWWRNTLVMVQDHFWLGVGLSNFKINYPPYHRAIETDFSFSEDKQLNRVHNDHLQMLAELGAIGFCFYAAMFATFLYMFWQIFRSTGGGYRLRAIFIALSVVVSFVLVASFTFPLERAMPTTYLFTLFALMSCLYRQCVPRSLRISSFWKQAGLRAAIAVVAVVFGCCSFTTFSKLVTSDKNFVAGISLGDAGDITRANAALRKAKIFSRFNFNISALLARNLTMLGKYPEAIQEYAECLSIHPYNMNALLNTGYCYLQLKDYENAEKFFKQYLKIKPDSAKGYNNLGIVYFWQKQYEKAVEFYNRAIELDQEYPEPQFNLGNLYRTKGDIPAAVAHYETAMNMRPGMPAARLALARLYLSKNDYAKTSETLTPLLQGAADDAEPFILQGTALQRQGKHQEAIMFFLNAAQRDQKNPTAFYNVGLSHYYLGNLDKAVQAFNYASSLNPDMIEPHAMLGQIYLKKDDLKASLQCFLRALQIDPSRADLRFNIGTLYLRLNQKDLALQAYIDTLKLAPNYAPAHHNVATLLMEKGDYQQAVQHFKKALEYNDNQINVAMVQKALKELEGKLRRQ